MSLSISSSRRTHYLAGYRPQLEPLGDRLAPGSLSAGAGGPDIDPSILMAIDHSQPAYQLGQNDSQVVSVITGGGQASFDDRDGGTTFGIGVTLYEDGTTQGHFLCLVPGIVGINGHIDSWSEQDGVVTVSGAAKVNCPSMPHSEDPACQDVTFELTIDAAGGPGVGHFTYNDSYLVSQGFPPDQETLDVGQIQLHTPKG